MVEKNYYLQIIRDEINMYAKHKVKGDESSIEVYVGYVLWHICS